MRHSRKGNCKSKPDYPRLLVSLRRKWARQAKRHNAARRNGIGIPNGPGDGQTGLN